MTSATRSSLLKKGFPIASLAALSLSVALGALLTPACGNPVVDDKIEALGGEQPGVAQGAFHRPGQPCLLCHSKYYGAKPEFAVGGTVFAGLGSFQTAENVEVVLTDSIGVTRSAFTNCIGNFYITADQWNPQFPLAAEIRYPVNDANGVPTTDAAGAPIQKVKAMGSVISRDGSCASCHTLYGRRPAVDDSMNPVWYDTTGWIYCNGPGDTEFFPPLAATCTGKLPTDANAGGTAASTGTGAVQ